MAQNQNWPNRIMHNIGSDPLWQSGGRYVCMFFFSLWKLQYYLGEIVNNIQNRKKGQRYLKTGLFLEFEKIRLINFHQIYSQNK